MERDNHNGENFRYVVSYNLVGAPDANAKTIEVTDWRQSEVVIADQEGFHEYHIYVQAVNSEGVSPQQTFDRRIGFSSQKSKYWRLIKLKNTPTPNRVRFMSYWAIH